MPSSGEGVSWSESHQFSEGKRERKDESSDCEVTNLGFHPSAPPAVRSGGGRNKGATGNFWGVMPLFTILNVVMVSWAYSHVVFEYVKFTILYTVIKATYACCTHFKYIYLFVILLSSHKEFEVASPLYPTIPNSLAAFPPLF